MSVRVAMLVGLVAVSSLATFAVDTAQAVVVAPGTVNNPGLAAQCGLKVVLVVDSSGSIGANAPQVTGAVGTFLDQLIGTGSQVGLVDFDTQVNSTIPFTPVTTASRNGVFQTYLNSYSAGGGTNWAMALNTSRSMSATSTTATGRKTDLVLFITDGRPTYRGGYTPPTGPAIPLTDDGNGSETSGPERTEAANRADEIKLLQTHVFLVGVGTALSNPTAGDLQSIRAVTGDQQYPTVTNSFANADYSLIGNFNQLATSLRDLVYSVCDTSVTVTKLMESGGVTQPANNVSFTGTVASVGGGNNSFEWKLPAGGGPQTAPNSRIVTTTGAGTASFQWVPGSIAAPLPQSSTFTLQEGPLALGTVFVSATCTVRLPDNTSTTAPYTMGTPLTVPRGAVTACTVTNRRVSTITLQKQWANALVGDTAAVSAAFPPGATYPGGSANATSTAVGGSQLDAALATLVVPVGATLTLSETVTGAGYSSVLACNGVVIPTTQVGTTFTGTYVVPDIPSLNCRFANTRNLTAIVLDKLWGEGSTPGDTVTLTLTPPVGTPSVVQNTVGGAGQAGPLSVLVGDTIIVSEAFAVGAASNYATNLTCPNANGALTYTPGALSGTIVIDALDAGGVVHCSFSNDPRTARVVLAKVLDPVLDPGRFDLSVNGGAATFPSAANGDATLPLTVNLGSTVTLVETAAVDTDLANYSSSLACDNGVTPTNGSFVVPVSAAGLTITCSFTNSRLRAQMLITKQWGGPVDPTQAVTAGSASGQDLVGKVFVNDGTTPTPFVMDVVVGETVRLGERFVATDAANYAIELHCGTVAVALEAPVPGDPDSPPPVLRGAPPAAGVDFLANFEVPVAAAGGQVLCVFTNARNSSTMTLQKTWTSASAGDSAQLAIDGLVDGTASAVATGATGSETSQTAATTSIYAGEIVTLSETLVAAGGGRYAPALTCTDAAGLTYSALSTSGTYTVPSTPLPVTCTFTNTKEPSPTITKVVASQPTRNADGTYTLDFDIMVSNPGQLPLDYTLTDSFAFASGVQVRQVAVTNIAPGGLPVNPGFNGSTDTIVASSTMAPGASHRYRVAVTADVSGVTTMSAFDCTLDPGEPGTGFLNRATVNPTAEACAPIPAQADIRVAKTVDQSTVTVGGATPPTLTYHVVANNLGPAAAANVVIVDTLPAGVAFVSASSTVGPCGFANGAVRCGPGALAAGQQGDATIVISLPITIPAGPLVNSAAVESETPDPSPSTNSGSVAVEVVASLAPLPRTGAELADTLVPAALLIVCGGVLVVITTRRRASRRQPRL